MHGGKVAGQARCERPACLLDEEQVGENAFLSFRKGGKNECSTTGTAFVQHSVCHRDSLAWNANADIVYRRRLKEWRPHLQRWKLQSRTNSMAAGQLGSRCPPRIRSSSSETRIPSLMGLASTLFKKHGEGGRRDRGTRETIQIVSCRRWKRP